MLFYYITTDIEYDLLRKSIEDLYLLSEKHGIVEDNKDLLSRVSSEEYL